MVKVGDVIEHTAAVGDGPVNALDHALRKALENFYPQLKEVKLLDYKVRVLTGRHGTGSRVRVLIESGIRKKSGGRSAYRKILSKPVGKPWPIALNIN